MTPWQKYKEKIGTTRPWDIINPNTEEATKRFNVCEQCPELIKITKQCKQCGCFMKLKTQLKEAKCPIGKW